MTTTVDIFNRALQVIGSRTTVASTSENSNEAIQLNLIYQDIRDQLLRMAPWDCAFNTANLTYITSVPGTPENTSPGTQLWQKGQPAPPWAYEYQYPVDCLRMCYLTPQYATGFAGGVPITTAVTGGAPSFWQGQPVRFKVAVDQFYALTGVSILSGGSGYVVGEVITLASGDAGDPPIGAPAQLLVTSTNLGAITGVSIVTDVVNETYGGSYFTVQSDPLTQGSSSGNGSGATFSGTWSSQIDQRVILTNQEFANANYIKRVTDPNVMDPMFVEAWVNILGSKVAMRLSGDKSLVNLCIGVANKIIVEARAADGNEGLTINDNTPDWIRTRGIRYTGYMSGPYQGFDWGSMWPLV